jgi:hypothetical protein
VLYVTGLAASFTVDTMPDRPWRPSPTTASSADSCPPTGVAGVDVRSLAEELQREEAEALADSWQDLLARIRSRHRELSAAR